MVHITYRHHRTAEKGSHQRGFPERGIMEVTKETLGISRTEVYKCMPDEKAENAFALPKALQMAEKRRPHLTKVIINGKSYIDVTDLYIPY